MAKFFSDDLRHEHLDKEGKISRAMSHILNRVANATNPKTDENGNLYILVDEALLDGIVEPVKTRLEEEDFELVKVDDGYRIIF